MKYDFLTSSHEDLRLLPLVGGGLETHMKKFSQRDTRWGSKKLGFSKTSTIAGYGCKLTSFACVSGIEPDKLNGQFQKDGAFFKEDLLSDEACAKSLGWKFLKKTTDAPKKGICIAEVDMSPAPGKQQHFVVYRPSKGRILDPWTGTDRPKNTYPFVNFRIFEIQKEKSELPDHLVAPEIAPTASETSEEVQDTKTSAKSVTEMNVVSQGTRPRSLTRSLIQNILNFIKQLYADRK